MALFPEEDTNSHYFSRHDENELLGSASLHSFELDGKTWPTVEHYYQAMVFENQPSLVNKIMFTKTAIDAAKVGKWRFWQKRKDLKKVQSIIMTRALYTKCKTHADVAQALLDTDQLRLVENNNYDYYWGCGRDRRGENAYGKVLMNVREKLLEEKGK
jgi:ribA/ribD-fused uncharacterized protein